MNKTIVHILGENDNGTQKCDRCGVTLWTRNEVDKSPLPVGASVSFATKALMFHYGGFDPHRFAICAPTMETVQGILPKP